MRLTLRYFASVRESIGLATEAYDGPATDLATLRDELIGRGAAYAEVLARGRTLRMAVNHVLCDESAALGEGAEVAFFPPVTGG